MFNLSRNRIIVLVVLTGMLLITLDQRGNAALDRVRSLFATVMRPFDTAVEAVALPIERAWDGISRVDDLERENEALRDQLARVKGSEIEAQSAILAYRELLKVNQLTSKFNYPVRPAQVVGNSPSNFQNTVEINVGSNQGVEAGMPVIDGAGLIGRISQVFPNSSVVLLITDPSFSINAQVLTPDHDVAVDDTPSSSTTPTGIPVDDLGTTTTSTTTTTTLPPPIDPGSTTTSSTSSTSSLPDGGTTTSTTEVRVVRETGQCEGRGVGRTLVLRFTDTTSSLSGVKVGSIVDTAGGNSSLAPQGIPIGIISKVERASGSSAAIVEVTPNSSLEQLNFVAVVLYVPNDAVGR